MPERHHTSKARPIARGELTDQETLKLMQAFTLGKTAILEEDAITLLRWATEMRLGAVLVDMILAGEVRPIVQDGTVRVVYLGSRN